MYWASSWARSGRSVISSSTASCGLAQAAGGVQPRGEREGDVLGVQIAASRPDSATFISAVSPSDGLA